MPLVRSEPPAGVDGPSTGPPSPGANVRTLWVWGCLATCAAALPFVPALSGSRVFYIRDLSLYFWGRYLWLRRTLLSGESPLWNPYVGAGQAALADALHQMFLLPTLAIRLAGDEVLGFNLWVALPFPFAALGAWLFLSRRFSGAAAALGAIAFSVSGPVVSTGSFPNMSWSVAALPWVLWTVDRVGSNPTPRRVAMLALTVAFQALAGEPVTLLATLVLAFAYAVVVATPSGAERREHVRHAASTAAGFGLGLLLAAIQLVPTAHAALVAERADVITRNFWSLHPIRLLEAISLHLFGNYYTTQSLAAVPWMPALNGGREPFLFSIYFGVPLLALAIVGAAAGGRRWAIFWTAAAAVGLVGALGGHTPIYPFLQENIPLIASFRFPVKYLVFTSMAVAAAAAAGWEALARGVPGVAERPVDSGRRAAISFCVGAGLLACAAAAMCLYFATPAAFQLFTFARALEIRDAIGAAEFMLRVLPRVGARVFLLSLAAAVLLALARSRGRHVSLARGALYALILGDLLVRAWGINPAFDRKYFARPAWMSRMAQGDWRFYVGGKRDGTLDPGDPDSSRAFRNPPGLSGSASRAALSRQAAFFPAASRRREVLSYDLAVLWPRLFEVTTKRFFAATPEERDRFLDRTGVRYRILPPWRARGRTPLVRVPYFLESFLFDWGRDITRRVSVVSHARVVPDVRQQIEALFKPGWDARRTALIAREPGAAGAPGTPMAPSARFLVDAATRVVVEAGVGAGGGYLILLDSFSREWRVNVDGRRAVMVRANGLFRAVRLARGRHVVEFVYRPRALLWGAGMSCVAFVVVLVLVASQRRQK